MFDNLSNQTLSFSLKTKLFCWSTFSVLSALWLIQEANCNTECLKDRNNVWKIEKCLKDRKNVWKIETMFERFEQSLIRPKFFPLLGAAKIGAAKICLLQPLLWLSAPFVCNGSLTFLTLGRFCMILGSRTEQWRKETKKRTLHFFFDWTTQS